MSRRDPLDLVESMGTTPVDPDPAFRDRLLAELLADGVLPTAPHAPSTASDPEDASGPPTLISIREHELMSTSPRRGRLALLAGGAAAALVLIVVGAVTLLDDGDTIETATTTSAPVVVATTTAPTTTAATEPAEPPAFDVSGTWDTSFGELTLTMDGSTVSGTAMLDDWTAIYEGELVGDLVTGTWYPEVAGIPCAEERLGTSSWGTFAWTFDGPDAFTGTEGNCLDEHQLEWRGTRVIEEAAPDTVPGPPGLDVSGTWETDIGELTLTARGGTVTGTYLLAPPRAGGGEIEAEFDGETLVGTWTEAVTSQICDEARLGTPYWGTFEFSFDGDEFTGSRGLCDGDRDESWNGARPAG
ncbi:MAG: hypothetical protein AAGA99_11985 [Actinomycetota bacterium]